MGFLSCQTDPDVWIRDRGDHYEYLCVYVDDLIIISKTPMEIIEDLKNKCGYTLKGVGVPEYYLGGDIRREKKKDDSAQTIVTAKTYIRNVCDMIEKLFEIQLQNVASLLVGGYHPEPDTSPFLPPELITKYRMLVGSAKLGSNIRTFRYPVCSSNYGKIQSLTS